MRYRMTTALAVLVIVVAALFIRSEKADAWQTLDLKLWLSEPGVRFLVINFYDGKCTDKTCKKIDAHWQRLLKTYRARGLRVVVVSVPENGNCPNPGWIPDKTICDLDGSITKKWFAKPMVSTPESFLWSWQGNLLVSHGSVGEIEDALKERIKARSKLIVGAPHDGDYTALAGKDGGYWTRKFLRHLRTLDKLEPIDGSREKRAFKSLKMEADPKAFSAFGHCTVGRELGEYSYLDIGVIGDPKKPTRLKLSLYDLSNHCKQAAITQKDLPEKAAQAAARAVSELVVEAIGNVVIPGANTIWYLRQQPPRVESSGAIALIGPQIPVTFDTAPQGATITRDDTTVCYETPCMAMFQEGDYLLDFRLEGFPAVGKTLAVSGSMEPFVVDLSETFGTVSISSEPDGVPVRVNGEDVGKTPLDVKLAPGTHEVTVVGDAFYSQHWKVSLARGERKPLKINPRQRTGTLFVQAENPYAEADDGVVLLGGKPVGKVGQALSVPIGEHELTVRQASGTGHVSASIKQGRTTRVSVQLVWDAGIDWVPISGGWFEMGKASSKGDSAPVHRVRIGGFKLARNETTIAQYRACVASGSCEPPKTGPSCNWSRPMRDDHPANCTDWTQAAAFCRWAGGRLPSEAEWEYAAGGAKKHNYPWGGQAASCDRAVMDLDGVGGGCGERRTWPVCSKPDGNSPDGLCDLAGNVWEWMADSYQDSYKDAPKDGGAWVVPEARTRVMRGGGFQSAAFYLQRTTRGSSVPAVHDVDMGFRCAMDEDKK